MCMLYNFIQILQFERGLCDSYFVLQFLCV